LCSFDPCSLKNPLSQFDGIGGSDSQRRLKYSGLVTPPWVIRVEAVLRQLVEVNDSLFRIRQDHQQSTRRIFVECGVIATAASGCQYNLPWLIAGINRFSRSASCPALSAPWHF
jgi:hypothetical protein